MRRLSPRAAPALWLAIGAIALRLLLFLGRGDYVAFDEAWYLILGRNLWSGYGFTLSGLRHVALSPLFPILAGAAGRTLGNPVWGGRLVAALASGLLVLPCWTVFSRLGGRRSALLACAFVAVLPSLAPFVAPELVGWDLWVGAGPLFHLFLFSGMALLLGALPSRSRPGERLLRWALAGAAFGLAFLDRPEAVLAAPLIVAAAVALYPGRLRRLPGAALCALGFLLVTAPYFLYLHDALGHWALTGRSVAVGARAVGRAARSGLAGEGGTIESMLWDGKQAAYAEGLYRLDSSGTRMADTYWGVPPRGATQASQRPAGSGASAASPADGAAPVPVPAAPAPAALPASRDALQPEKPPAALHRAGLYASALGMVLPWFLWPLALAGAVAPGRRRMRAELVAFAPLAVTSVAVALLVAIDPRTQLFLAPALAWYTARGVRLLAGVVARRTGPELGRGFLSLALGGSVVLVLLGVDARRLWLGLGGDAVHQLIGSADREVGASLRRLVPPDETVMSWSPAPAVWADRDWQPLPVASLPAVLTFAAATHSRWIVFSTLNPSPLPREQMPKAFLVTRVMPGAAASSRWSLRIDSVAGQHAVGVLGPADSTGATWPR